MISYTACPICNKMLETGTFGTIDAGPGEYCGTLLEMYSKDCIGHRFENVVTLDKAVVTATVEIPLRPSEGELSILIDDKPFTFKTDLIIRVNNIYNEHYEKKSRNSYSALFIYPGIRYAIQKAGLLIKDSISTDTIDYSPEYIEKNTLIIKKLINFDFPTLEKLKQKAKMLLTFQ